MTQEQREKAWAAAQAIYDAFEFRASAEELGVALLQLVQSEERIHLEDADHRIVEEIASHLFTLHDEAVK